MQWIFSLFLIISIINGDSQGHPNEDNGSGKLSLTNLDRTRFAAAPTNLSASISVYNATKKQLQMIIRWTPSTSGRIADSYNIHVDPLNLSNELCSSEPIYVYIQDSNISSWAIIPTDGSSDYFRITAGCSYTIKLEANPHNGKTYAQTNLTVPDCVEGVVCSCRYAKSLPCPEIQVTQTNETTMNITWTVKSIQNISSFVLRAGPKFINGHQSALYNLSWVHNMNISKIGTYHSFYSAKTAGTYAAVVRAVDNRDCLGPEQQVLFSVERSNLTTGHTIFTTIEIFWKFCLLFGTFVAVFCLFGFNTSKKCMFWLENKKQAAQVISQGILYHKVCVKSAKIFRRSDSLQQRNVLYIEKEIEEAQSRGEVDGYEISYNRLTFEKEIGHGAFGQVFLAKAEAIRGNPDSQLVAVKKLKAKAGPEEKEEFLEEIEMLKKVGRHPNIVELFGCCTLHSELCAVMEYVPCGDLRNYLQNLRKQLMDKKISVSSMSDVTYSSQSTSMTSLYSEQTFVGNSEEIKLICNFDHRELQNFALQISNGMAHLEAKRITHRDLAARNVLVDRNKILKISDFGLSRRGVYINTRRCKVPLRWLSIEAMRDSLYSSKSDVWAFAILLWEIGTLGGFPYPTVTDYNLCNFLLEGNRLEKPEIVGEHLYAMMLKCWSERPDDRPSFAELISCLEPRSARHIYVKIPPDPHLPPMCPDRLDG